MDVSDDAHTIVWYHGMAVICNRRASMKSRSRLGSFKWHVMRAKHSGSLIGADQCRGDARRMIYTAEIESVNQLLSVLVDDCCPGHPEVGLALASKQSARDCLNVR